MKKIYRNIGATAFFDIGNIYRKKRAFLSYCISGELDYKINRRLRFIVTQQITHRNDLKTLYNTKNEFIISGFLGIKYSL